MTTETKRKDQGKMHTKKNETKKKPYPLSHECDWCAAPANYVVYAVTDHEGDQLPSAQVYAYSDDGEHLELSGTIFGPGGLESGEGSFVCHQHLLDEIENTIDGAEPSAPVTFAETIEQVVAIDEDGSHVRTIEIVTDGAVYLDRIWAEMNAAERREYNEWVEEMHGADVAIASAMPDVRALAERLLAEMDPEIEWWASAATRALKRAREIVARPDYEEIVETA